MQVHSADVRVRILFPLGFAFFLVLALLAGSSSIRWSWGHLFFFPFQSSAALAHVEAMRRKIESGD
jgi:hypothetical protein